METMEQEEATGSYPEPDSQGSLHVIQEIYDGENSQEAFENELDRAIEAGCETIVIEPAQLGEETARWIAVGNCLHKTAVLSGFGSLLSGLVWPEKLYLYCPLATISLFCTGLYTVSWATDPCCKYQAESNPEKLNKLQLHLFSAAVPVVLVRKDDSRRKFLHSTLSLVSAGYCLWRLYKAYD